MNHIPTILVVDDDFNLRMTLAEILHLKGYQTLTADTGQEALALAQQNEIDVAVIDLLLEDMPGLQVLHGLKSITPETACILLTGYASQDSAIEAVNAGAYSYFVKPANIDQLLLTIQRAIEKRQADRALLESERHYQALAEVSPTGIFRTDALGETTYVNPRWSQIAGIPFEKALKNSWIQAVYPDEREKLLASWQQVVREQKVSVAEYRFLRPDGSVAWVIGQAVPEYNTTGEFIGYIGTITDISGRIQVENALRRSEEQYRLITDHIEDIVWQLDKDLRFIYTSPAIQHLLGYSPEESRQLSMSDLLNGEDVAKMHTAFQARLSQGAQSAATPMEYHMKHKEGWWIPVEVVASPVYDAEEQMSGFVGVTREITERKRAEKIIRESEQRIKRLLDQQIAVNQLALALGEILDLDIIYRTIYEHIRALVDVGIFIVSSFDEQTRLIRAEFAIYDGQTLNVSGFPPLALAEEGEGNQSRAIHLGQPFYIPDHRRTGQQSVQRYLIDTDGSVSPVDKNAVSEATNEADQEVALSALYVPMKAKGKSIGIMQLQSRQLDAYSEQDIQLLAAMANVAAVAIQNASLHQEIQRELEERKRAEEQLLLQGTALEAAANSIVITDQNGEIEWVNPAFCILTGYSREEVIGQNPRILVSGFQDHVFYKNLWETILAGKIWRGELVNKRKDGSLYTAEETITPLMNESGKITHFICIMLDITERKRAEEAIGRNLSELEVLYENGLTLARLIERQEIGQRIIDLIATRLHWHHAVLRLYNAERGILEVLGFNHANQAADHVEEVEEERRRLEEIPMKAGIGLTGWVLTHGEIVRSGNLTADERFLETYPGMQSGLYVPILAGGQAIGVISIESEQANAFTAADERLLVTLAAQAAAAFENARLYGEALHRLEELAAVAQISAAMRTASGRAEMLPIVLQQTIRVLPAGGAAFAFRDQATGDTLFELGVGTLSEFTGKRIPLGNGITAWVMGNGEFYVSQDVTADPHFYALPNVTLPKSMAFVPLISQSHVIGAILIGSDIPIEADKVKLLHAIADIAANAIQRIALYEQTLGYAAELEQRVNERTAELRITNAALERASRSKDEFLASMSHELRTPLTGILNLSEVLQEQIYGPLNDKQAGYIRTIEESGRHLLGLINDILDISKIEAGQFELQFDVCQVDTLCQSSLHLTKGLAGKKNQQVSYSILPPHIEIQADSRRLKQMLVNLLSNAVKFTPPGGKIGLEVSADEETQSVHFSVWDTGIGIAEQDIPRLFRPFTQLDASLSRPHEGTGLGLAIVQRLADKHGGSVSLESTPGQGSRFTIHLPWKNSSQPEEWPAGDARSPAPKKRHTAPLSVQPRIPLHKPGLLLLADDNQINIEIYAEYLRERGYQVILAYNGQEAVEVARQQHPDLILMDIQMPGMDGLAAISQLRAAEDLHVAQVPVIALTALAMPGDRERCLQAGANHYLSKPVGLRDLVRVVQTYLKP